MPFDRTGTRTGFWAKHRGMRIPFSQKRFFAVDDHRCSECGASFALVGRTHRCVPNNTSTVPNKLKTGDAQRVAKWKAANKEKDRAYHRELMRKRRAAGK